MRKGTWMVGLAALFATACATEAPPRSYVQPNAIKKSDLDGTFYYLQTVTDAPPTNGAMFIGQSSSLLKIKFDIQENYLYARRAFPQIDGSEDQYNLDPANYKGQPLAAWRIESQFDIIRDYNSSTGEQTNKIVESTERPWQQRQFIRVDWSQNLVTDYVGLGMDMFFSDVSPQIQQVSYWESDPSKPDALHIEHLAADQGGMKKGEMSYLDVTDEMVVTPDMLTLDFGPGQSFSIPKCLMSYKLDDCASQVVKVRHAFMKIDPKHDVEVRDWDGNQMNMFGVWDVGLRRLAYNRDYGFTNSGITRTAARFNIWEKSCKPSAKDLEGNPATSCEARPRNDGSGKVDFVVNADVVATWDPAKDSTQPMLPGDDPRDPRLAWKDRTLKTIPYFAEGSMPITYQGDKQFPDGMEDKIFPPSLFPTFQNIVGQWNDAMKAAVKDMTGKDAPHDIFVPCHDPVASSDPKACSEGLVPDVDGNGNVVNDKQGKPVLHARAGDPRHSCVFWVNQEQASGPLGYGPPLYDEITGETISGQAYIYGAALDWYAVRSRDMMLLENGELDQQGYISGQNVIASVKESRLGRSPARTFTPKELAADAGAMDFSWAKGLSPEHGYPQIDTSSVKNLKQSLAIREKSIWNGFYSHETPTTDEKLARLSGTPLEKMMMNTEMMTVNGASPTTDWDSLTDYQKIFLSPVRRKALDRVMEKYRIGAEMRGADFAEFGDPGLQSGLSMFTQKYCPNLQPGQTCALTPHADEMRQDLRQKIFLSVTLHEVGHNMGCRHNFRGSWDSMDYFPQYWQIREDGMQHPDSDMAPSDGKLHPRYVNIAGGKASQWELNQGIRNYQYSSIMDYGAEFNSDLQGLGLYDKAFIKFSYGHYVEVFTDAKTDAPSQEAISSLQQFQSALGFPSALGAGQGLSAIAYQTYPNLFQSGYQGIYKRKDVPLWDIKSKEINAQTGDTIQADKSGDALVPYYFCSDEFAEGNLTCKRFDAGADAYEQAQDIISRYQNFYLYNNFKRDRATFYSSAGYLNYIYDRYFEPLRDQLTWYVLLRSDFENFLATNKSLGVSGFDDPHGQASKFFTDENGWGNFTAGVNMGFNLLGQVLTTPSAGWHMKATDAEGNVLWKQFRDDVTDSPEPGVIQTVPLIDGKYVDTTWDDTCGYYVFDECQQRIGYFVDKTVALDVLAESQAYFTGRDTSVDVRQYAIGYVLPFKRQIEEKFGALLSEDYKSLAPYFQTVGGQQQVVNPSWTLDDPTVQKANPIDPQTGFTLNLYTGIYALAAFPSTFDHDFIDNTKIFVVGNGEASTTDAQIQANGTYDPRQLVSHCDSNGSCGTKEWLLYQDPSGELLAAHATPASSIDVLDENSTDSSNDYSTKTVALRRDIGVRMLERMRQLDALVQDANASGDSTQISFAQDEYQKFRENIQVIRSLENAFGYGPFMTDAPFYY